MNVSKRPLTKEEVAEGCRSICMKGGALQSGSTVVNILLGISRRTANPIGDPYARIDYQSKHECASLDNEQSCSRLACPSAVSDPVLKKLNW